MQKKKAKELGIAFANISVSPIKNKKYRITLPDGTKIDYGAFGMEDYLIHKDKKRRELFHKRFRNNRGYDNPASPLYYSRLLLW